MMQEPVFDLDQSLRRLDGDRELYCDLIGFFLEDSPRLLDQLRAALAGQDAKAATHAAHTLKGLAANFTARRAFETADSVERLSAGKAFSEAKGTTERLEQEVGELQQALRTLRETLR